MRGPEVVALSSTSEEVRITNTLCFVIWLTIHLPNSQVAPPAPKHDDTKTMQEDCLGFGESSMGGVGVVVKIHLMLHSHPYND